MQEPNKLPLVKQSLGMLLDELTADDTVSIVTYAGYRGHRARADAVRDKGKIEAVIDSFRRGRIHRRGGRYPPGLRSSPSEPRHERRQPRHPRDRRRLQRRHHRPGRAEGFIERERENGVFLSVLGFGMGNYNDALMQTLAQNGNGAAAYIDTLDEGAEDARRGSELDACSRSPRT